MTRTVRQYYAWLACVMGSGDDDIESQMAGIYDDLKIPSVDYRGRLAAVDVVDDVCNVGSRKVLELKLETPSEAQSLRFDLHDRLTQAMVRKLEMIDPELDVEIRLWLRDSDSYCAPRDDYSFVTVRQGRYCFDAYLGEPWHPEPGETLATFDEDYDYAIRVVEKHLQQYTLNWHCNVAGKLARRVGTVLRRSVRTASPNVGVKLSVERHTVCCQSKARNPWDLESL